MTRATKWVSSCFVIFFSSRLAIFACRACHSSGTFFSFWHTRTHARTQAHTHARARTHTHTHILAHQVDCTGFRVTGKRQELLSCFVVACCYGYSTSQCCDIAQLASTSKLKELSISHYVQRLTLQWITLSTLLMMAHKAETSVQGWSVDPMDDVILTHNADSVFFVWVFVSSSFLPAECLLGDKGKPKLECQNGGICKTRYNIGKTEYKCFCPSGFKGDLCQNGKSKQARETWKGVAKGLEKERMVGGGGGGDR